MKNTSTGLTSYMIPILLFFSICCSSSLCVSDGCDEFVTNHFEIPFVPLTTFAYQVGDTVQLRSSFSSQLMLEDGQEFDNSNQNVSFNMEIFEIVETSSSAVGARDKFELLQVLGSYNKSSNPNDNSEGWISVTCGEEICAFDIGLITQSRGYYCLRFGSSTFSNLTELCVDNYTNLRVVEGDNNFSILEEIGHDLVRLDRTLYRAADNSSNVEELYFFKVE